MTEKHYLVSMKYKARCYRHVGVPLDITLEEFADAILWAFDFINDHAHAFFMDNRSWSDKDSYYASWVDEDDEYRHTDEYKVNVLSVGQKFKFIFDFGDEWTFQGEVLREVEPNYHEDIIDYEGVFLVKEVGESPDQSGLSDDFF